MPQDTLDTHQKALTLNLARRTYGTLAEIGAGQEVAAWFFWVGATSGTVAQTVSAYDMTVSDESYGQVGRHVSKERLKRMLESEFALLVARLREKRGGERTFFAFASTVSTQNYFGTNICHGWVGLRFQSAPGSKANTIVLHTHMRDSTNLLQQEALGILGINVIYGAFYLQEDLGDFLPALLDDLSLQRIVSTLGIALRRREVPQSGLAELTYVSSRSAIRHIFRYGIETGVLVSSPAPERL